MRRIALIVALIWSICGVCAAVDSNDSTPHVDMVTGRIHASQISIIDVVKDQQSLFLASSTEALRAALENLDFNVSVDEYMSALETLNEKARRIVFVDFDGTAAWQILVANQGTEFSQVLNIGNLLLASEVNKAISLLATEDYRLQREALQKCLTNLGLPEAPEHVQPKVFMQILRYFVDAISQGVEGFTSRYEPVDKDFVNLILKQKRLGAELFVLSARPYTKERGEFLLMHYGEAFSLSDFKRTFFEKTLPLVKGDEDIFMDLDTSYIFSKDKFRVVAHAPSAEFGRDYIVTLFDDHASRMMTYYKEAMVRELEASSYTSHYLLVPFPAILTRFDARRLIDEMIELFALFTFEQAVLFLPR